MNGYCHVAVGIVISIIWAFTLPGKNGRCANIILITMINKDGDKRIMIVVMEENAWIVAQVRASVHWIAWDDGGSSGWGRNQLPRCSKSRKALLHGTLFCPCLARFGSLGVGYLISQCVIFFLFVKVTGIISLTDRMHKGRPWSQDEVHFRWYLECIYQARNVSDVISKLSRRVIFCDTGRHYQVLIWLDTTDVI